MGEGGACEAEEWVRIPESEGEIWIRILELRSWTSHSAALSPSFLI